MSQQPQPVRPTAPRSAVLLHFPPRDQDDLEQVLHSLDEVRAAFAEGARHFQYGLSMLHSLEQRIYEAQLLTNRQTNMALNEPLSPRELQILELIATGRTNFQIANTLILAEGTIRNHVSAILAKLRVSSRLEAVTKARTLGIL